jgi:hypothetical protein
MNTTENDKLIAEFMEFKVDEESKNYLVPMRLAEIGNHSEWADSEFIDEIGYYLLSENQLCFSFDWNWLMQVVDKIESLGYELFIETFEVRIEKHRETLFRQHTKVSNQTKIEAVYNACVSFVKWYNQTK